MFACWLQHFLSELCSFVVVVVVVIVFMLLSSGDFFLLLYFTTCFIFGLKEPKNKTARTLFDDSICSC